MRTRLLLSHWTLFHGRNRRIGAVIADPNSPFSEPSTFIDPLTDSAACARDLPFLQQLGVNAIRIYSVNSSLNHDDCMNAFSKAGIYTMYVVEHLSDAPVFTVIL